MKNMKRGLCYFAVLAVSIFTLASCSCTQGACADDAIEPTPPAEVVVPVASFPDSLVHFGFDRYDLSMEATSILDEKIDWLRNNPDRDITVEGHADEVGTYEYNLALGDRRANAVKQYMTDNGIDANRISTISYGEERPIAHEGNAAAWAMNRRAQFVLR